MEILKRLAQGARELLKERDVVSFHPAPRSGFCSDCERCDTCGDERPRELAWRCPPAAHAWTCGRCGALAQLAILKRKNQEYYNLIESLIGERDEWKQMWFETSREAGRAQGALVRRLTARTTQLRAALLEINTYRKALDLKQVEAQEDLLAPPFSEVEEFEALIKRLKSLSPAEIDGLKRRDEIKKIPGVDQ